MDSQWEYHRNTMLNHPVTWGPQAWPRSPHGHLFSTHIQASSTASSTLEGTSTFTGSPFRTWSPSANWPFTKAPSSSLPLARIRRCTGNLRQGPLGGPFGLWKTDLFKQSSMINQTFSKYKGDVQPMVWLILEIQLPTTHAVLATRCRRHWPTKRRRALLPARTSSSASATPPERGGIASEEWAKSQILSGL